MARSTSIRPNSASKSKILASCQIAHDEHLPRMAGCDRTGNRIELNRGPARRLGEFDTSEGGEAVNCNGQPDLRRRRTVTWLTRGREKARGTARV